MLFKILDVYSLFCNVYRWNMRIQSPDSSSTCFRLNYFHKIKGTLLHSMTSWWITSGIFLKSVTSICVFSRPRAGEGCDRRKQPDAGSFVCRNFRLPSRHSSRLRFMIPSFSSSYRSSKAARDETLVNRYRLASCWEHKLPPWVGDPLQLGASELSPRRGARLCWCNWALSD